MHRLRSSHLLAMVILLALVSLVAAGCGGDEDTQTDATQATETTGAAPATETTGATSDNGTAATSGDDADLVAKAKEEGGVTVLTGAHTLEQIELVAKEFESAYGIPVTFSRQNSGAVAQQIEAQLSAGAMDVDVVASNDEPTMVKWAADGVLVDPELPNRDQIMDVFDDGTQAYVPFAWIPMGIMYNTTAVQEDELPSTWKEFPSAIGDRVVVHADPRASGVALSFTWAVDEITDGSFYTDLTGKEVTVSESGTGVGAIVLAGEADYAIPGPEVIMAPLLAENEPVGIKYMDDGIPGTKNLIGLVGDAPHPSAARLFMQFQMSAEFQRTQAEQAGTRSILDGGAVPPGLPEIDPNNILLVDSEDLRARRDELTTTFEQILQ